MIEHKKMRSPQVKAIVLCIGLATIVACSPITRNYGYVPPDEDLAEVAVGKDTRDSVAEKVGLPLNRGIEADKAWYYVSTRRETFGPRAPKIVDRQVVAIRFNDAGSVENIERYGVEDGEIVVLTSRVTNPAVSDVGLLRQIFGNLGGPSAGTFLE